MRATIMPVTKLRARLLELVKKAKRLGNEIIITTDGEPTAVLMGFDEWESIMETLEIQSSPNLMKQIRASQKYFKRGGKGIPIEKIDWGKV